MARSPILLGHGRAAWKATGQAQGHAEIGLDLRVESRLEGTFSTRPQFA